MNLDFFSGTWKGELILPSQMTITKEEKITEFFFRIKNDIASGTFNGIFILNPKDSLIQEHAKLAGEFLVDSGINFEIRYSKFYFYTDQTEKEMVSLTDNILTKVKFKGSLSKSKMLFGSWESEPTLFEYEGMVRKTMPRKGTWWAKKCPNKYLKGTNTIF